MTDPKPSLTELMGEVRDHGASWAAPQVVSAAPAELARAWAASDDPFAMMLLLAALHPGRHVETCRALASALSFFPPMAREAERQARSLPGMHYDGPDRFRFLHLAQHVRGALRELDATTRAELGPRLCDAIRRVVADPVAAPDRDG